MSNNVINSDIYDIMNTTNELQKKFMEDVDSDTLMMSTYGYLNEKLSNILQQAIIMAGQWGNEALPIRAKFDKTILTDAITYDISNINAIPATMNIMLGFIEKELSSFIDTEGKFIIDRETPIQIGDYEFHLDYNLIITKQSLPNAGTFYTARYDMGINNSLSDITSPFLQPPITLSKNGDMFIFIYCTIRQVKIDKTYSKIISNNILENKTVDFEYGEQLAGFDVKVINADNSVDYLTPVYDGMPYNTNKFCYYTYLDTDTIRLKFDKDYYEPNLNSTVEITVYTTEGKNGNFKYVDDIIDTMKCVGTSNTLSSLITPIGGSSGGLDKKSIDDIKQIIPKEILSRKNIICEKDLDNFFNSLDVDNRLVFYKGTDNQFMRLYHAYFLAKDEDANVIPTNTIDLLIKDSNFTATDNDRYVISPGTPIVFDDNGYGIIADENTNLDKCKFIYSSPFTIVINKSPLCISYYLDVIDTDYDLKFTYINQNSFLQMISTYMHVHKNYLEDDSYKFTLSLTQNVNMDEGLVTIDENGYRTYNLKIALVFDIDESHCYYKFGTITGYNPTTYSYDVEFEIPSKGIVDTNNKIRLDDVYIAGTKELSHMYLDSKAKIYVYVYYKMDKEYGRYDNDVVIPDMQGYTLSNILQPINNVDLFYNYSNIIKSTVTIANRYDEVYGHTYKLKSVPLFRKSYIDDIDRCSNIINDIHYRKLYIDKALETLENSFEIDFKFYNTYGPSTTFYIGYNGEMLNRTNLTLNFRVKLQVGADNHIIDKLTIAIKNYIEDINTITNNIHMSNLITSVTDMYSSEIQFIEFVGINEYNALIQYIERKEIDELDQVPEFLNINLSNDLVPDINIVTV